MNQETPITRQITVEPGYENLLEILLLAYDQAALGKGKERHAGSLPFDEQPMQSISDLLGTERGMAFQAIKKLREALDLPDTEKQIAELLGAINYTAGIVLYLRRKDAPRVEASRQHMLARLEGLSLTERGR